MKRCPKCHAQYGDGATYCESCGEKLVKFKVCPHCRAEVDEDALFCSKCGKSINEVETVPEVFSEKPDHSKIEQYKREVAAYRSKRASMLTVGSILLGVGLTLFIIFLSLFINLAYQASEEVLFSRGTLYMFLSIIGELMVDAGAALMIVAGAVFSKKIANRERIIQESENR